MWRAWERHAKVDSGGYAGVESVLRGDGGEKNRVDKMESFWLGETLKYLYLLFTDDPAVLPSSCFVFNTEAHPVPVLTNGRPIEARASRGSCENTPRPSPRDTRRRRGTSSGGRDETRENPSRE